jgi:membrane-anchored protein YejM (alkaline phosphatase superfamily)
MIHNMNSYFTAEKQESFIFMAVGLVAIALSIWLWMNDHRLKSMAYPLVIIGVMQLVVGSTVYLRTDLQVSTLTAQLQQNPESFQRDETSRMHTVMKNFSMYKMIEMLLLITGLAMIAFWQRNDIAAGIGVGFVLQAAITLTLDIFAETRGSDYLVALQGMQS